MPLLAFWKLREHFQFALAAFLMATHVLGLLAFWKLGEHFQFARALMSTSDKALSDGGHFLMDDSSLFTVLTQYDINEAMYEKARKYRQEKSTLLPALVKGLAANVNRYQIPWE